MTRRHWLGETSLGFLGLTNGLGCGRSTTSATVLSDPTIRAMPHALLWRNLAMVDSPEAALSRAALRRFISEPYPDNRYHRLHWLRFFGPALRSVNAPDLDGLISNSEREVLVATRDRLLDELLSSAKYHESYAEPIHIVTRHGVGFITAEGQASRQSGFADPHPDKILSLFALSGVPSTRKLEVNGQEYVVADCIRCALRNLNLNAELPWSVIAACHFLAPSNSWFDKTDARVCFDDLGNRLCDLEIGQGSCFGHHVPIALATLLITSNVFSSLILQSTGRRILSTLKHASELARERQTSDGSFVADWTGRNPTHDGDTFRARFISTSHALEWLSVLRANNGHADRLCQEAANWLCHALLNSNQDAMRQNYSVASHAAFGLVSLFDCSTGVATTK